MSIRPSYVVDSDTEQILVDHLQSVNRNEGLACLVKNQQIVAKDRSHYRQIENRLQLLKRLQKTNLDAFTTFAITLAYSNLRSRRGFSRRAVTPALPRRPAQEIHDERAS